MTHFAPVRQLCASCIFELAQSRLGPLAQLVRQFVLGAPLLEGGTYNWRKEWRGPFSNRRTDAENFWESAPVRKASFTRSLNSKSDLLWP